MDSSQGVIGDGDGYEIEHSKEEMSSVSARFLTGRRFLSTVGAGGVTVGALKEFLSNWKLVAVWAFALLIVGNVVYFGTRPFPPASSVSARDDVGTGSVRVIRPSGTPLASIAPVAAVAPAAKPFICPDSAPLSGVTAIQLGAAYVGKDLVLTVTDQRNRRLMCAQFSQSGSSNNATSILGPADEHGQVTVFNPRYSVKGQIAYYGQASVVFGIPITR